MNSSVLFLTLLVYNLDFRTGMSSADTAGHLRSGDIDIAHDLLPADHDKILRDPRLRLRLVEMPEKNTFFLLFNQSGPTAVNQTKNLVCGSPELG